MASLVHRIVRRVRYGRPIVVVSGLPRSGTSLAMSMLAAGGMPVLTDGIRLPDDSNPKGYYEFEPVKDLHKDGDPAWLLQAQGKAIKIVSFLLTWLPESYDYRVIFMQRDLREVIQSETAMLARRGEPAGAGDEAHTLRVYENHLEKVHRFLSTRRCFQTLPVNFREALEQPEAAARRIRTFVEQPLDIDKMTGVADPALYRNRRDPT